MNKGDKGYVAAVINQKKYNLTFEQQEFVKNNIGKTKSLVELLQQTFKEESLNEKSSEYDDLRKFVAKLKRDVSANFDLSAEQIEFIESNASTMRPFEVAKNLFPDKELQPLGLEAKTVADFISASGFGQDDKDNDEYRPAKAASSLVRKINSADPNANFDANDLAPFQRKCVDGLRSYLQSIRFCSYMKIFEEADMKEMFEEEFVKGVYDKPDLNSEELNMYINLCAEYINIHQIHKSKVILENKINDNLTGDSNEKLYLTWVELLDKREKDLSNSKKQATALQEKLSSTRSKRLESLAQANESLSKFVEEWKSEDGRKRALKIAEARNLLVKNEADRIESLDEYIASVFGTSMDEILKN